jgi:hypothetical protein
MMSSPCSSPTTKMPGSSWTGRLDVKAVAGQGAFGLLARGNDGLFASIHVYNAKNGAAACLGAFSNPPTFHVTISSFFARVMPTYSSRKRPSVYSIRAR